MESHDERDGHALPFARDTGHIPLILRGNIFLALVGCLFLYFSQIKEFANPHDELLSVRSVCIQITFSDGLAMGLPGSSCQASQVCIFAFITCVCGKRRSFATTCYGVPQCQDKRYATS